MRISLAVFLVAGLVFYIGFDIGKQAGMARGSVGKFECKIVEVTHG